MCIEVRFLANFSLVGCDQTCIFNVIIQAGYATK